MFLIFGESSKSKFQRICDDVIADSYRYRVGTGCYKGNKEYSIIVQKEVGQPEVEFINDGLRIAQRNNQECVLLVSDKGWGNLLYPTEDGFDAKDIGIIKRVTSNAAMKYDGYSCFGQDYFVFELPQEV